MNDPGLPKLTVRAEWDAEAGVWVAESEDVPGLVTEADTLKRLVDRLRVLVPELLDLNGATQRSAPIELVTRLPDNSRRAEVCGRLQRDSALVRKHVSTAEGDRFVDAALVDVRNWQG
ncbi:MAG: DUF1902 domain-containing protein [Geminicoccaceae bacterium]